MEILSNKTCVDMTQPVITLKNRELGYKFMVAEAWWILNGKNNVDDIRKYSNGISDYSDDGVYYHGAYGPKVVDQLTYVVDALAGDPLSRQAVLNIWRENPRQSKDVPCTLSIQFAIRDNRLHCVDTMRSSDAWLGWPYDVFNFSMVAAHVRELLIHRNKIYETLRLGNLYLNAGSSHLYETNLDKARAAAKLSDQYSQVIFKPEELEIPIIKYLHEMKDYRYGITPNFQGGFLDKLFKERYGQGAR